MTDETDPSPDERYGFLFADGATSRLMDWYRTRGAALLDGRCPRCGSAVEALATVWRCPHCRMAGPRPPEAGCPACHPEGTALAERIEVAPLIRNGHNGHGPGNGQAGHGHGGANGHGGRNGGHGGPPDAARPRGPGRSKAGRDRRYRL